MIVTTPEEALVSFEVPGPVRYLEGAGLINGTWSVGEPPRYALQRVNAIFPPGVQDRIHRITERLAERGMATPRIVPDRTGRLAVPGPDGTCWRLLTWIPGTTWDRVPGPEQARSAAALVGRFHGALVGLEAELVPLRPGVHDTPAHLGRLDAAIGACASHRLAEGIRATGEGIQEMACRWRERAFTPILPERPAHGDLKISNVRFDVEGREALCLLDLDTLALLTLDAELGDALRSWCNPSREDDPSPALDLEVFGSAVAGYASTALFASPDEIRSLPSGLWRISLELAARFCADAFHESYFGWNPRVASGRGEHNLIRARNQLGLAKAVESAWDPLCRIGDSAARGLRANQQEGD